MEPKYWSGTVKSHDDFQLPIGDVFVDGKTAMGPWAIMTPKSFSMYGLGLRVGFGQMYKKQVDGRWLKISDSQGRIQE